MTKTAHLIIGLLTGILLACLSFALSAKGISTQDPARLAPQMYRVVLDNNHVRVMDYHLKAGGREPMHSHPSGVVVYFFTDANMRVSEPDGKIVNSHNKAGDVLWRDPVTHSGENIGNTEVHELLVEPKHSGK